MEKQDILVNEEVFEAAEEITEAGFGKGLKVTGAVVAVVGAIYGGYRLVKKLKAKKVQYGTPLVDENQEDKIVVEVEDNE